MTNHYTYVYVLDDDLHIYVYLGCALAVNSSTRCRKMLRNTVGIVSFVAPEERGRRDLECCWEPKIHERPLLLTG